MGRHGAVIGVAGVGAGLLALAAGCGGGSGGRVSHGTQALTPADFGGGGTTAVASGDSAEPAAPSQPLVETQKPVVTGPVAASEGVMNITAHAGPPRTAAPVSASGEPVLVDAKIGDINGKPVFASRFLSTRADLLRARATELRQKGGAGWKQQWRTDAEADFKTGLNAMINDELLRAEAIANFTPEQRAGFLRFMETISEDLASKNRGSLTAADASLGSKGTSVQEYLREAEIKQLVGFQLQRSVINRVNVSWRDIKQWYETHPELYNKPPRAQFRLVQISNRNAQAIEEFKQALADGKETFEALAKKPYNANNPAEGGLEEKELTADRATMEFYGNAELNKAARTLEPGGTAGPIAFGSYTAWLHLDGIVRENRTLYDEQIRIETGLKAIKMQTEHQKYMMRLRSKATVTSVDEMAKRLLVIAEERYLPREN